MQSTLVEVKSALDIFRMQIESPSNKKLYNKCIKLMESGDRSAAADLLRKQDFKRDSTLCMLLSQCICPQFPYHIDEVEKDVDFYLKNKLIVSKHSVLRTDDFGSII
jgi:hypothetical protein